MRDVPVSMWNTWLGGDYTGDSKRPMCRVTIQIPVVSTWQTRISRYRSTFLTAEYLGDGLQNPRELPNLKSFKYTRDLTQPVAVATFEFFNQAAIQQHPSHIGGVGGQPIVYQNGQDELDSPGYYTYNRGYDGVYWSRWGYPQNPWYGMLVPDRVLRTYQGYGWDPNAIPEEDSHLVQTGEWWIDKVDYSATNGLIVVHCRDRAGPGLVDQITFPPVVPLADYPVVASPKSNTPPQPSVRYTDQSIHWAADSNFPYVGAGGAVLGHYGHDAFDGNLHTYWLSIGNALPNADYSFEYVEAAVGGADVTDVVFWPWAGNYRVYVSVAVNGAWQGTQTVPYNENDPISKNNADIPYVMETTCGFETETRLKLPQVFHHVTAVRLTFTNLYNSGDGPYPYRAGVRKIVVQNDGKATAAATTDPNFMGVDGNPADSNGNYTDYCLRSSTQILTRRGWLSYDEVRPGDEALSINPFTGMAEWDEVTDVFEKHRKREMISMESQSHSSLSTPDHRWLTISASNGDLRFRTTEELTTNDRIPLAAPRSDAPQVPSWSDEFVELVAWWWTEGSRSENGGGEIGQSHRVNPAYVERVRTCLSKLYGPPGPMRRSARVHPKTVEMARDLRAQGCGYGEIASRVGISHKTVRVWERTGWQPWALWNERVAEDRGMTLFNLSQQVVKDLDAVGGKEPCVEYLAELTAGQLDLFIETSIDADGHRKGAAGFFAQRSEQRAAIFQAACALAGRATNCYVANGMFNVTVKRHLVFSPHACRMTRVQYDGIIWCPTLRRNHTWLARDNGSVYFTGNSDIVKWMLGWGGFYWPRSGSPSGGAENSGFGGIFVEYSDESFVDMSWTGPVDPVVDGRIWGDIENAGTYGPVPIPISQFDKKPLMDNITYVQDILGYIFFVDEEGAAVFRSPNMWKMGNFVQTASSSPKKYTAFIPTIDERTILLDLTASVSKANSRYRNYVGNVDGKIGAASDGREQFPVGWMRIGVWTDQFFATEAECRVMADLISVRQLMTFRSDEVKIAGMPALQPDDQVRIFERTTAESYVHYINKIDMNFDYETGEYSMTLGTNWLGDRPFTNWFVDPKSLSKDTQDFLRALGKI